MKDVIQTYRDSKGRYTNKGYAFDDDKIIAALEQSIVRSLKKALWLGALIGFTIGLVIGVLL